MDYRTAFVMNSSISSFVIARKKTLTTDQLKETLLNDKSWLNRIVERYNYDFYSLGELLADLTENFGGVEGYVDFIIGIIFEKTKADFSAPIGDYYVSSVVKYGDEYYPWAAFITTYKTNEDDDLVIHGG